MTVEEKAKAYDIIIQRVTELYETGTILTKEQMEHLFPELCESNDEKIMKILSDVFADSGDRFISEYERRLVVSWLEKQKEQKHYWKPTETDTALFNKAVTTNKALTPTERAQLDIIRSKFGYCRAVNCSGIMQEEQEPAEWSEKDEKIRKQLINICDEWIIGGYSARPCLNDVRWLKNLLEKQKEPTLAEWSEEDKDMLNCCISSIEEAKENRYAYKETDGDTSYDREIAFLKSLRPSWKPSEEQMEGLKFFLEFHRSQRNVGTVNWREYDAIESLYEDLKKLWYGSTGQNLCFKTNL